MSPSRSSLWFDTPRSQLIPRGLIRSVLLSTDYVPESVVAELQDVWGCSVYQHYGMTEMGYGGEIDCDAHDGYHLREADLLVEIIDPATARGAGPSARDQRGCCHGDFGHRSDTVEPRDLDFDRCR